jgi:hypothetical protein
MAILLTAAEKRVLELVSQSQTSREIAASCGGQSCHSKDSAEKLVGMLRQAQHERKISNNLNRSSVRPEALEG